MLLLLALSLTNAALPPQFQTQAEVERILDSPYFKKMSKGMNAPNAAELTQSRRDSERYLGCTEYNTYLSPKSGEGYHDEYMYVVEMNITILPYESECCGPLEFGLLYSPEGVVEAAPGRSDKPPMPIDISKIIIEPPMPTPMPLPFPLEPVKLGASMAAPASKQSKDAGKQGADAAAQAAVAAGVATAAGAAGAAAGVEALRKQIEAIVAANGISGAILKEIEDLLAKTAAMSIAGGVAGVIAEELLRREIEKLLGPLGPFGPFGPIVGPFGPFAPLGPFGLPLGPGPALQPNGTPFAAQATQAKASKSLPIGPIGPIMPFPIKQLDAKVYEQTLKVGEMGYFEETAMTGYYGAKSPRESLGNYHAADDKVVSCSFTELDSRCGGTDCAQQFYALKAGETVVTNDRSNSVYKITVTE